MERRERNRDILYKRNLRSLQTDTLAGARPPSACGPFRARPAPSGPSSFPDGGPAAAGRAGTGGAAAARLEGAARRRDSGGLAPGPACPHPAYPPDHPRTRPSPARL